MDAEKCRLAIKQTNDNPLAGQDTRKFLGEVWGPVVIDRHADFHTASGSTLKNLSRLLPYLIAMEDVSLEYNRVNGSIDVSK
jgi:hypothetical protein